MGPYEVWGSEIPNENRMFVAVWEFRKQFYRAVDSPEYYDAVREEAERIFAQYPTQLCHDLLWSVIHECERRSNYDKNAKTQSSSA